MITKVAAHTKGPWESRPTAGHDIHGQSVVYSETGNDVAIVYDGDADARLIAAAPEMLEALESLLDIAPLATDEASKNIHKRAIAAIRKAKGE